MGSKKLKYILLATKFLENSRMAVKSNQALGLIIFIFNPVDLILDGCTAQLKWLIASNLTHQILKMANPGIDNLQLLDYILKVTKPFQSLSQCHYNCLKYLVDLAGASDIFVNMLLKEKFNGIKQLGIVDNAGLYEYFTLAMKECMDGLQSTVGVAEHQIIYDGCERRKREELEEIAKLLSFSGAEGWESPLEKIAFFLPLFLPRYMQFYIEGKRYFTAPEIDKGDLRYRVMSTYILPSVEMIDLTAPRDANLKIVFWDFVDTIWTGYPRYLIIEPWVKWVTGKDKPSIDEIIMVQKFLEQTTGLSLDERFEAWRRDKGHLPSNAKDFKQYLRKLIQEEVQRENLVTSDYLVPGIKELLTALAEADVKLAIVSAGAVETQKKYTEKLDISRYFVSICGEGTKAEAMVSLMNKFKIEPNEALMVGDRVNDIKEARKAGIAGFGFATNVNQRRRLIEAGANGIINFNYIDIEEILRKWGIFRKASKGTSTSSPLGPLFVIRGLFAITLTVCAGLWFFYRRFLAGKKFPWEDATPFADRKSTRLNST